MIGYWEFSPPKELSDYIECFWIMKRAGTHETIEDILIPNVCAELVISRGEGYSRTTGSISKLRNIQGLHLLAPRSCPQKIMEFQDHGYDVGIRFTPFGLGEILVDRNDDIVDFEEAFNFEFRWFEDQILRAKSAAEALCILGKLARIICVELPEIDRLAKKAIELIHQNLGQIKVADLYDKCCCSKSNFERRFSRATGRTAKNYIRKVRFDRVLFEILKKQNTSFAATALKFGFYDQAHFNHEFKKRVGIKPTEYLSSHFIFKDVFAKEIRYRNELYC